MICPLNRLQNGINVYLALRFTAYRVRVALDKGLETTKKKEIFTWPPKYEEEVSRGATSEKQDGEETEETLLVVHDMEREVGDTCPFCCCCSCQCKEKLEKYQGNQFSQLNCGGAFCSFKISLFKQGAALEE